MNDKKHPGAVHDLVCMRLRIVALASFAFAAVFAVRATWKASSAEPPTQVVTTQASLHPSPQTDSSTAYRKIQEMELGQRVIGENPLRDEVDRSLPEPDAATWQALTLVMTKADGKRLDIGLLRPTEWIEAQNAKPGGTIQLDLEELGASGPATVLSIAPCPPIEEGPGEVVTGTFAHESSHQVLDVSIAGEAKPIGVTSNHPFWSVDRNAFVPAGELRIGETLDTLTGQTKVTAISARGPPEPVYNLEVHAEHVYRVAESGVLVHNNYVVLYHGSPGVLEGGAFDLAKAAAHQRPGTPEAGIYLTTDFVRAATGYGRGGTVTRVVVPKELAESWRRLGGPKGNQVEYFVNSIDGVNVLNENLTTLPTLEAIQQFFKQAF